MSSSNLISHAYRTTNISFCYIDMYRVYTWIISSFSQTRWEILICWTYMFSGEIIQWKSVFINPVFMNLLHLWTFFSIPLRFPISPNIKNVGFYELRFLWTSALMNFFQSSLECLFKLITPDFMNFLDMELIKSFSENLILFMSW